MATYPLTLTNPGAELGNTSGWTSRSGGVPAATNSAGHSGSWFFTATASGATAKWDQEVAIPAPNVAAVDAGTMYVEGSAWQWGFTDTDHGNIYVECYAADGTTLLGTLTGIDTDCDVWTKRYAGGLVPVNTRFLRIGTNNIRVTGTENSVYWDDFELTLGDAQFTKAVVTSVSTQVLHGGYPAQARVTSMSIQVLRSISNAVIISAARRRPVVLS